LIQVFPYPYVRHHGEQKIQDHFGARMLHRSQSWTGAMTQSKLIILPALLASMILAIAGCAANSNSARSEMSQASSGPSHTLSPEQCASGAVIEAGYGPDDKYVIAPGDELDISFYMNPEFDDSVTVRPDGNATLRMIGDVHAAGLTPEAMAQELDKDYNSELRSPNAQVRVKQSPSRQVYVEGQVTKAGAVPLEPGMTALQAIADSGGVTTEASDTAVVIRRDVCGTPQKIKIDLDAATKDPSKGEDIAMMPRDVLYVPRSGIANLDVWIDQNIRKLIPIDPYMGLPF
jgi:protein involved in polysaccharide export with SLBB domain